MIKNVQFGLKLIGILEIWLKHEPRARVCRSVSFISAICAHAWTDMGENNEYGLFLVKGKKEDIHRRLTQIDFLFVLRYKK